MYISGFKSEIDVILLTETWKFPDMNLFKIPNYSAIYNEKELLYM